MRQITTNSPKETFQLGVEIGTRIQPGAVICLSGEMGAGKTAITQGIVKGMGIETYVTSPTYTIVNEYLGKVPVYHFDVFRIEDGEELFQIGFDEYLYGQGVVIIEWAPMIKEFLPKEYLWISMEKGQQGEERLLTFTGMGKYYEELIKEL